MSNIESIENKLSELIPSSVSQQGLDRIDETIERLAQESLASGESLESLSSRTPPVQIYAGITVVSGE